jgi:hypothetical protein
VTGVRDAHKARLQEPIKKIFAVFHRRETVGLPTDDQGWQLDLVNAIHHIEVVAGYEIIVDYFMINLKHAPVGKLHQSLWG